MITIDDFIVDLKRSNQFGDEAITNDRVTSDLIRWINRYRLQVANMTAWSWLLKTFTVTLVAGVQEITIDATIHKVLAISDGQGGRLQKISLKDAMDWNTPAVTPNNTDNLLLGYFIDYGIDGTTGARKIKVFGKPGSSGSLTAYGTKVFSPFTVADIALQTNCLPFSDEIMNMIGDLVSARIAKFKGDASWVQQEKVAMDNLRIAMGEEQSDPSNDVTTGLPPYYKKRAIMRRGGMVA